MIAVTQQYGQPPRPISIERATCRRCSFAKRGSCAIASSCSRRWRLSSAANGDGWLFNVKHPWRGFGSVLDHVRPLCHPMDRSVSRVQLAGDLPEVQAFASEAPNSTASSARRGRPPRFLHVWFGLQFGGIIGRLRAKTFPSCIVHPCTHRVPHFGGRNDLSVFAAYWNQ